MNKSEPGRSHILVVTDRAADLQVLTTFLTEHGHEVRSATSEEPALSATRESPPDLILVSTSTTSTPAGQIIHRLKGEASTRDIPVLVGIDLDDAEARARVFALGAVDYLTRPFHEGEVLARVEAQLALGSMGRRLAEVDAQLARETAARLELEEALQDAEQSGLELFESLSEVIYTVDVDGVLTYVSPAIEKLIGYPPAELIGHNVREFIHHEDLARLADNLQRVLSGEQSADEYRLLAKSGEIHWIRTSSQPALVEDRVVGVQGVFADITEPKLAEEQIREQNEFLNRILESLTHPFYVVDAQDYTIKIANSAARVEARSGQATCYALTHGRSGPCDTPEHPCPLEEIKRTKKPARVEHVHLDADGHARNVEVFGYPLCDGDGNVVRVIEYTLDVTERKQTEAALQRSEARWRSVAQNSPDHVLLLDTELKIDFVNYPSPGLTIEELIGTPLYTYVEESDQARVRGILENALKTAEPTSYETEFSAPDGSTIYYESRVVPKMLDDQVVGLAVNARDITEHKQAAQALRQSEKRYRQLLDALQEGIWVIDQDAKTAFVNPRMAEMLGYTVEEMQDQHLNSFMDEQGVEITRRNLERRAQGIREQHDFEFLRKDGSRLYALLETSPIFDDDGEYVGAIAGIQDITERRKAEEALRKSEALLQETQQMASLGGWELDLSTSQVTWTDEVYRIHEVPAEFEPDLETALDFYHPQDRPTLQQAIQEAATSGKPWDLELRFITACGNRLWVRAIGRSERQNGKVVRLSGTFQDITERKQAEQALEEAAAAAERNRLARDLHDSVTQALFSASLVAEILPQVWQRDPEEAREGLEELRLLTRGALAEMRTMLLELRPTALVETKLEDLLWQLTEAITSRVQVLATFNIEPAPALPPDVHVTFYRVAQEALHNVVKHAEADHLVISVHVSPPLPPQGIDDWRGQLILQVRDDGQGFDPGDTEPGQLGLSIMRERAEAIGAVLTIASQPGRGTQVTLAWHSR